MKDLKDWNKQTLGETINLYLKSAWYFETWWEKVALILLLNLGLWKIAGWIF